MESLRFLLRDRDGKYGKTFDTVFQTDDLRVIESAPQEPRMNAHTEGVVPRRGANGPAAGGLRGGP